MNDSRNRAVKKYLSKQDDILFRVHKGRRAEIKAHAEALGMSLNAYLNQLIDRDMGSAE